MTYIYAQNLEFYLLYKSSKLRPFPYVWGQMDVCIVFSVKFCTKIVFEARLGDVSTSSKRRCEIWKIDFFSLKIWCIFKIGWYSKV